MFEITATFKEWPQDTWKKVAGQYMGDMYKEAYLKLYNDYGMCTWHIFKEQFIRTFKSSQHKRMAKTAFEALDPTKCKDNQDFYMQGFKLLRQAGETDPNMIAFHLSGKMKPEMQRALNHYDFDEDDPNALAAMLYTTQKEELIQKRMEQQKKFETMEKLYEADQKNKEMQKQNDQFPHFRNKSYQGVKQNFSRSQPNFNNFRGNSFNRHRYGTYRRSYRYNQFADSRNQTQQNDERNQNNQFQCFHCLGYGHSQRYCQLKNMSKIEAVKLMLRNTGQLEEANNPTQMNSTANQRAYRQQYDHKLNQNPRQQNQSTRVSTVTFEQQPQTEYDPNSQGVLQ